MAFWFITERWVSQVNQVSEVQSEKMSQVKA
jgi:hypothetical protein